MKKIFVLTAVLFCVAMLFTTCDKVEGPYYEVVEQEDVTVEFPDVDPAKVYRKMLIEEFTGHLCVNCPAGHRTLEQLHQHYGDTLVTVGIHCTRLAEPEPGTLYDYDFCTEAGSEISAFYGIDAIPSAIFNRNYEEMGWPRAEWTTVAEAIDRSQVYAAVQLINEYDASARKLKANVKVTMLKNYQHPLRLLLFLLEDGVVKPQKDGTQDVEEYVHNHVLRYAFTDPFGYPLGNNMSSWQIGDEELFAAKVSFDGTDWVPENCHVVAALYDHESKEVLQVEQLNVVNVVR